MDCLYSLFPSSQPCGAISFVFEIPCADLGFFQRESNFLMRGEKIQLPLLADQICNVEFPTENESECFPWTCRSGNTLMIENVDFYIKTDCKTIEIVSLWVSVRMGE